MAVEYIKRLNPKHIGLKINNVVNLDSISNLEQSREAQNHFGFLDLKKDDLLTLELLTDRAIISGNSEVSNKIPMIILMLQELHKSALCGEPGLTMLNTTVDQIPFDSIIGPCKLPLLNGTGTGRDFILRMSHDTFKVLRDTKVSYQYKIKTNGE